MARLHKLPALLEKEALMDDVTDFPEVTVDQVMAATGVDRQSVDRRLAELMLDTRTVTLPKTSPDHVSVTLKNSSSGAVVRKHLALGKTVREILVFDSLNLFPDVQSATYRVLDYVVTHVRTGRILGHTETLQYAGVRENDTLEITSPRILGR